MSDPISIAPRVIHSVIMMRVVLIFSMAYLSVFLTNLEAIRALGFVDSSLPLREASSSSETSPCVASATALATDRRMSLP